MATSISAINQQAKKSEFDGHPILKQVASRVSRARKRKGWSKKELCKRSNVDDKVLTAIERGDRNYTVYNLLSVLNSLRISTLYKRKKRVEKDDDEFIPRPANPSGGPLS